MIRLLSVVGYGTNLIPHFIEHYSKFVDEIQLVVYQSIIEPNLINDVKKITSNYDNVKIVKTIEDRILDWEKVAALYNHVKSKKPNDWWVIANIDEFQLYTGDNFSRCIIDCENNGWDVVRGGVLDRVGPNGEIIDIEESINIFKQFPNMGFFSYPMTHLTPNKVCLIKGYIELTSRNNYAKINGDITSKWQGWSHPLIAPIDFISTQVHSFKWEKTFINQIKTIISNNQSHSGEYLTIFKELTKMKFKIDLKNPEFMFEQSEGQTQFKRYKQWNKLIKKIVSI